MLYEDNYLAHYGIKSMRWGIRRFQNPDGSLTPEGRIRYKRALEEIFDKSQKRVRTKMTNKYAKLNREPIDRDKVTKRGGLTNEEADECIAIATELYKQAADIEPMITKDVITAVENTNSAMYGLNYRLKQPTSIAAKIGADAKDRNLSFEEAALGVKDVIRYTSISSDGKYVADYNSIKAQLEGKGYKEIRCRNYFEMYKLGEVQHKSIQCIYEDQNGNRFELQFQTPSSQAVKDAKIPLYEEIRSSGISEERKKEIEREMHDLAEYIPYPNGIEQIKSYG